MAHVTVEISDELKAELEAFLRHEDTPGTTDRLVEDALRQYLADRRRWSGREYRPASRPFRVSPLMEKDDKGEPDVSINHDQYLAER
jgi:hypothetical protein